MGIGGGGMRKEEKVRGGGGRVEMGGYGGRRWKGVRV